MLDSAETRCICVVAIAVVLLGSACGGSDTNARDIESVVEAFEAEGLPTLIALNRDAEAAPTTGNIIFTRRTRPRDTVEGLLQLFSYDQPEYVRGLAFSADPDHEALRSTGGRWRVYVLDSKERVDKFDAAGSSPVPPAVFVRVQRHNVVVLTRTQFRAPVERALKRTD